MKLDAVVSILEDLAPLRFASSWDNVGLLVGDPDADVRKVLVTVDYTEYVAEEARDSGVDLVVAYHPPMFSAVKRVPHDALWADAVRRGIALYSMHTALDVAPLGTNDVLADACGVASSDRRALRAPSQDDAIYKIVTFVPEESVDAVGEALFQAGAGKIGGAYSRCSFRASGTGTFFGDEAANPAVGERGRLERVPEVRLETVLPKGRVDHVVRALRAAHPYEEPAFDLVALAPIPSPDGSALGLGRVGSVEPTTLSELVLTVKSKLALASVLVADAGTKRVTRVAVAAGSGGDLLADAARAKADVFVTGELRHHDALTAVRRGISVVATLHSNSERLAVRRFGERLATRAPELEIRTSAADRDPFSIV